MSADLHPLIRKHQIWAGRAEPARRFWVWGVSDYSVRGWHYYAHKSTTRDKTMPVDVFREVFTLVEDTPDNLRQVSDVSA